MALPIPLPAIPLQIGLAGFGLATLGTYVCLTMLERAGRAQGELGPRWRAASGAALGTTAWAVQALMLPTLSGLDVARWMLVGQGLAWLVAVLLGLLTTAFMARVQTHRRGLLMAVIAAIVTIVVTPTLGMLSAVLPQPQVPYGLDWLAGIGGVAVLLCVCAALVVRANASRSNPRRALALLGSAGAAFSMVWCTALTAGNQSASAATEVVAGKLLRQVEATGGTVSGEALWLLAAVGVPALFFAMLLSAGVDQRIRRSLKSARTDLERAARLDPLTGLLNREALEARLLEMTARADVAEHALAILMVDVDGFKPVNEACGPAVGDKLLCALSSRLKEMTAKGSELGRLNGDRFVLLALITPNGPTAAERAAAIVERMQHPLTVAGREFSLSCSVGIAMFPEHGAASVLISRAERATAAAKRLGGATYCVYEPHMAAPPRDHVDLARDLRRAIEKNELELFYQPKVHAPSGEITGAEALMRWRHPQRGMVSPAVFIPVAERFGLIGALGNWLIDESCRQARVWRDEGLRMRVAINLSVQQMRQDDLVDRIGAALRKHRVNPRQFTCEITETAAMDDATSTLALFERLAQLGVHISIDDFGTGYSSLSYLRRLPAEELKIDMSFISDLETSGDARAIVDAVMRMAQALGLKVVAEGVETEGQQRILRALGCDELQGYLFAKPMSAKALTLWAMNDVGPRVMPFRNSLFADTSTTNLEASAELPAAAPAHATATSAPMAARRSASH